MNFGMRVTPGYIEELGARWVQWLSGPGAIIAGVTLGF